MTAKAEAAPFNIGALTSGVVTCRVYMTVVYEFINKTISHRETSQQLRDTNGRYWWRGPATRCVA
eukprot:714545-Pleurochrysis_carterae.AAC.1